MHGGLPYAHDATCMDLIIGLPQIVGTRVSLGLHVHDNACMLKWTRSAIISASMHACSMFSFLSLPPGVYERASLSCPRCALHHQAMGAAAPTSSSAAAAEEEGRDRGGEPPPGDFGKVRDTGCPEGVPARQFEGGRESTSCSDVAE